MNSVFIATNNPHKLRKMQDMFADTNTTIDSPNTLGVHLRVEETAKTFEGNATLKAVMYSKVYNGLVIASDGGMHIPSLKSWEPTRTKRFAGEEASDEDRVKLILKMMRGKTGAKRQMVWREAIAVARNGKKLFSIEVPGSNGVMAERFDPTKYRPGIWLCSIWEFPQFDGKNFFDLTKEEVAKAEISWERLGDAVKEYLTENDNFNYMI